MTPPQKQPAVTGPDIEEIIVRNEIGLNDAGVLADLMIERDEAIREAERLKENGTLVCQDMENDALKEALAAEKRRAAAYREVAINRGCSVCHGTTWDNQRESAVDLEAQKLLADSGGEKKGE